jgi:hypothetical protein
MVEGFFFRRLKSKDGKRIRRLLVKSPPGLGKTRQAIDWAIRYRAEQEGKDWLRLPIADHNEAGVNAQTSIFVPRHQLAEELKEVIESAFLERGEPITVPILRGRENGGEEGKAPCRRWREARELARKGLPIYTNLCHRRSDGQSCQCPYFGACEYIQTRQAAYCSPFVILVHSHLGLEWGATAAERFYEREDEGNGAERQKHFSPKQANIIICDEDPTISLVEEARLSPEDIRGLEADGLGETILAGLVDPAGLLSYLREQGVSELRLREAAEGARSRERHRGQISSPDAGDGTGSTQPNPRPGWYESRAYWSDLPMSWRVGAQARATRSWPTATASLPRGAGHGSSTISASLCSMGQRTSISSGSSYLSCRTSQRSASGETRG